MKAIFKAFPAPGIEVREVEAPLPGQGEVLLKVKAASICGSDLHIYHWRKGYEFLTPYLPVILGHEFAGEVVEAGPGAAEWNKGDQATAEVARICGECFYCKNGKFTLCEKRNVARMGIERNGGMAEYIAVPAASLHRLPRGVSCEEASLTEPCCVALGAVRRAHIFPGDAAAIIGPGPIGLMALQGARAAGARKVLMAGTSIDARRLRLAEDLGADRTVDVEKSDPVKAVKEMTDGMGAGAVFEVSGSIAGVNLALDMVRKGGEVILAGIYSGPVEVAVTQRIVREMKTLRGSFGTTSILWDTALELIASGAIKIKPLITHRVSIARGEEGFLAADRKEAVKALIIPP